MPLCQTLPPGTISLLLSAAVSRCFTVGEEKQMQCPCSFLPTGFVIFSENSRGGLDFFPELLRCEEQLGLPVGALPF